MALNPLIEEKINRYAERIVKGSAKVDEHALGELQFYMTLRRALSGKQTMQDVGMLDTINDILQAKGIIKSGETFYN